MLRAVIFDMFETLITHFHTPLYFGREMARDAGIEPELFLPPWRETEIPRTLGRMSLQEALDSILPPALPQRQAVIQRLYQRRVQVKEDCFKHLHPQILPLLRAIKERGLKIGLITNCYDEEALVIRKSALMSFFDAPILSCEAGLRKPDEAIFRLCAYTLHCRMDECLYIGDGGSHELQTAVSLGMRACQAQWYFQPEAYRACPPLEGFAQLSNPLDILAHLQP